MALDRIATLFGKTPSDLIGLALRRGAIPGLSGVVQFGVALDVSTAVRTLWGGSGLYPYPSSPLSMTVSSSSANDTLLGTGARRVIVEGLIGDFEPHSEIVELNGQTAVPTTEDWIRINRIIVDDVGSGTVNAGAIRIGTGTVTGGVPATTYGVVTAGDGVSLSSIYTVPAGFTGYGVVSSYYGGKGDEVNCRLFVRPQGKSFRVVTATRVFENQTEKTRDFVFAELAERTDVEIRVSAAAGNIDVAAYYEILLVDESNINLGSFL